MRKDDLDWSATAKVGFQKVDKNYYITSLLSTNLQKKYDQAYSFYPFDFTSLYAEYEKSYQGVQAN